MSAQATTAHAKDQHNYQGHLNLDALLSAMRPVTTHPEEHIFLTTHHSLEIWLKQIIFDLHRVIAHLDKDELNQANWLLNRLGEIMRLAEAHWVVLETMSAADFAEYRALLTGASGMQSRQFREIEVMLGLCEVADGEYSGRVEKLWPGLIAEHPNTLRKAFFGALERRGQSLLDVYANRWEQHDLFLLAEHAFELDRRFHSWRHNHILMVRRQIGIRALGTGGTFFDDYLAKTLRYYFFPELFEFRNELTAFMGGEVKPADAG